MHQFEYRTVNCENYKKHSFLMDELPVTDWTLHEGYDKFYSNTSQLCRICQDSHILHGFTTDF